MLDIILATTRTTHLSSRCKLVVIFLTHRLFSLSLGDAQRSMRWRPWSRSQNLSLWQQATDPPLARRGDGTAHPFLQGSTVPPTRSAGLPWVPHLLPFPAHTRPWCLFLTGSRNTSTLRGETQSAVLDSVTLDYRRDPAGLFIASILAMIQFLCISTLQVVPVSVLQLIFLILFLYSRQILVIQEKYKTL